MHHTTYEKHHTIFRTSNFLILVRARALIPIVLSMYRVLGAGEAHYSRPRDSILSNLTKLGTELGVTCEHRVRIREICHF